MILPITTGEKMKNISIDFGGMIIQIPLKDGKPHGEFYVDGPVGFIKGEFKDGKRHGKWSSDYDFRGYSDDGDNGEFKDGKKHGKWEHYEYDAENFGEDSRLSYLLSEGNYDQGKKVGTWVYYRYTREGVEHEIFEGLDEGIVKCKEYYDSGNLLRRSFFNDEHAFHGPLTVYDENGKPQTTEYIDGIRHKNSFEAFEQDLKALIEKHFTGEGESA